MFTLHFTLVHVNLQKFLEISSVSQVMWVTTESNKTIDIM